MEDDDDEVILKNSVLYTHLLENGLNDFESAEVEKVLHIEAPQGTLDQDGSENGDGPENADSLNNLVDIILDSSLVFHDDIVIIKNFIFVRQKSYAFLKSSYLKLIYQTSTASSICLLCSFRKFKFKPLMFISLSLAPLGLYIVKHLRQMYIEYRDRTRITKMVKNMKDLSMMLQKCIKFIQESEVLTYYSVSQSKIKSSLGISTGNDNHRGQIMFQLRRTVCDALSSIISNLKISICSLVKNFPIKKSADDMNFYLAFLNEDELHCSNEKKETITVDELQKMKYIYLLLQSEFLKRLCLNMNPSVGINRIRKDDLLNFVETICSSCDRLHLQIKEVFHIFYTLEKPTESKTSPNADWIYKEAYVKICSVSHNLQTLLKKSRHIEEYLENTRLQNSNHENVILKLDAFAEELEHSYKNSKSVIDDFYCYVLRQKPKPSGDDLSPVIPSIEETDTKEKIILPVGKSDFRPPCPDEIFIGVSTEEKKPEEENLDEDFIVSKKCSKLLISELKVALKDKAQEWKERERVALQNKNLVDEDDAESTEEDTSSSDDLNQIKTIENRIKRYSPESSESESDFDNRSAIQAFPTGATFAEKIAIASSKWALKSEEFMGDSDDDEVES